MNLILLFVFLVSGGRQSLAQSTETPHAQTVAIQNTKTIIIADQSHGDRWMMEYALEIFQTIKKADPSFDCIYLEVEPEAEIAIHSFLTGVEYNESVGVWISESSRKLKSSFNNIIPDWFLKAIHQLGYKIKGADVPWSSDLGRSIIEMFTDPNVKITENMHLLVEERNYIFATHIDKGLKDQECKKAVLLVGEAHIDPSTYKPVQDYVTDFALINFVWKF